MKKALALAFILILAISGVASAAKQSVTGSISVQGTPLYQHYLQFTWAVQGKPKGYEYPMVLVTCHQQDNPYAYSTLYPTDIVYRELGLPSDTFVIGGGSSAYVAWVNEGGSTAANCEAQLYLYPASTTHPPLLLATDTFIVP